MLVRAFNIARNELKYSFANIKPKDKKMRLSGIAAYVRNATNEKTLGTSPVFMVHKINVEIFEFVAAKSDRD